MMVTTLLSCHLIATAPLTWSYRCDIAPLSLALTPGRTSAEGTGRHAGAHGACHTDLNLGQVIRQCRGCQEAVHVYLVVEGAEARQRCQKLQYRSNEPQACDGSASWSFSLIRLHLDQLTGRGPQAPHLVPKYHRLSSDVLFSIMPAEVGHQGLVDGQILLWRQA